MSNKQSQQSNHKDANESALVRLSKIPIVEFSLYLSLTVYQKVKSSNELLNNVLNRTERVLVSTLGGLKPVANKFENQINSLDSLGNTLLDKVETIAPFIVKFQPKNVYANTANRVLSWRRYANDKVNVVRNFNLNKKVSNGLQTVDNLIDNYLPGTDDESNEQRDDSGVVNHVFGILGKLRRRSIRRLQNVQRLVL